MQINNFVVNYRGAPFTQNIQDNPALWRSVQVLYGLTALAVSGALEPLNDLLQVSYMLHVYMYICICICANIILSIQIPPAHITNYNVQNICNYKMNDALMNDRRTSTVGAISRGNPGIQILFDDVTGW